MLGLHEALHALVDERADQHDDEHDVDDDRSTQLHYGIDDPVDHDVAAETRARAEHR